MRRGVGESVKGRGVADEGDAGGARWVVGGGGRHPLAWMNEPVVWAVRAYQVVLSPVLGRQCRFVPSCSVYAVAALRRHAPWRAWWLVLGRVGRCNPFFRGGYDPVPGVDSARGPG